MNYTNESNINLRDVITFNFNKYIKKEEQAERVRDVLIFRMAGKTLFEIATIFKVTKERIRQMEAKGVEIIKHNL